MFPRVEGPVSIATRWGLIGIALAACAIAALSLASAAQASPLPTYCWSTVPENPFETFDFELIAEVLGPLPGGGYEYRYTLYRVDHGPRKQYRDLSHFSLRFPCGRTAVSGIVGGASGFVFEGTIGNPSVEMSSSAGLAEPALASECDRFYGFKLTWNDSPDVDGDGVSYPDDPDDDYAVVRFVADSSPMEGQWLAKGSRLLIDSGSVPVPDCPAPVPVQSATWGAIKSLYR